MLTKKTIIVTGAGNGLGRAFDFCSKGANVIGLGRSENSLKETKQLIDSKNFTYYIADVSNFSAIENCFQKIVDTHTTIDILFNNAAVYSKVNFLDESAEEWAKTISININGVANCCKAAVAGRIIHLSKTALHIQQVRAPFTQ